MLAHTGVQKIFSKRLLFSALGELGKSIGRPKK